MRNVVAVLTLVVLVGSLAAPAFAGKHEDKELGYSLIYPRKWVPRKFSSGDKWVVAQFETAREHFFTDNDGWTMGFKPKIDVVLIPLGLKKEGGARIEATEGGIRVRQAVPWTDLREYLEETSKRLGGFHFSKEEQTEVNGMTVMKYEITVDKLVDDNVRVYGWAYYTDDAIYGLVSHIPVEQEKKLKGVILGTFKTLKTFQRSGILPNTETTPRDIPLPTPEEANKPEVELTEKQLKEKRDAATESTLKRITEKLGKEWKVKKSKNYIAVSHADAKYTQKLLKQAEVLRAWLDKNLGYIGSGYTGKVVITICANSDEHSNYQRARGWFSNNPEIVTYKDRGGWSDWAMESLNDGIFDQWMDDKNANLRWGSPYWIRSGLSSFIKRARVKGSRLEFAADTWDSVKMKEARRDGKLIKAQDFFTLSSSELFGSWETGRQTPFFVKFLLVGAASRSAKYKNVFSDYMKALIFRLDEAAAEAEEAEEAGEGDEPPSRPQTEEEEDEAYKKRQESWRSNEKEHLRALMDRAFGDWTVKDWAKLNAVYMQEVK
jgi:hypothetical protein